MSLILDALNKADKEKHEPDASPGLDTEHELPEEIEELDSSKTKTILVSIALSAIVAVLIWSVFFRSEDVSHVQSNSASTPNANSQANNGGTNSSANLSPKKLNTNTTNKNQRKQELQQRIIEAQYQEQKTKLDEDNIPASSTKKTTASDFPQDNRISGLYADSSNEQVSNALDTEVNNTQSNTQDLQDSVVKNMNDAQSSGPSEEEIERLRLEALTNNTNEQINNIVNEEIMAINKERMQKRVQVNSTPEPEVRQQAKAINNTKTNDDLASKNGSQDEQVSSNNDDTQLAFYENIGSIRDLPLSTQSKIPTMMYTEHSYSSGSKSIVLNGKTYKENSRISGELRVDKILQDGVILRYQKHTFKMSAYNNYLNF